MPIQLKRSLTSGSLPTTASLVQGELALNVPDGRIFLRKSGSGSDTIQSAITTGAQNSGSVALTGSLSLYSPTGSVLDVSGDVVSIDGDIVEIAADTMEFTGSFLVSGSVNVFNNKFIVQSTGVNLGNLITDRHTVTGSLSVSGSITGSLFGTSSWAINSVNAPNPFPFTGSARITGSLIVTGSTSIEGDAFIYGIRAGRGNGANTNNTAFGVNSLNVTTGVYNTAVGYNSMLSNTSGERNAAFGWHSLKNNTAGSYNTAIGMWALESSNANNNVAIGYESLYSNTSGASNVAIGLSAMKSANASNCIGIGPNALDVVTGTDNYGIGGYALGKLTTGTYNISIGYASGFYFGTIGGSNFNTTGTTSIFIGYQASPLANGNTNQIVIGHNAVGLGSNTISIGNSSTVTAAIYGNMILGSTSTTGERLQVTGTTKLSGSLSITGSLSISGSRVSFVAQNISPTGSISSSYFTISGSISQPPFTGSRSTFVDITPTIGYTTSSQVNTAFRVNATFSGSSAFTSSQNNIIADFGASSAGSQLTITDVTSGSIYMVNDVSGLPIIEANSNWDVFIYDFPNTVFKKTGSALELGVNNNLTSSVTVKSDLILNEGYGITHRTSQVSSSTVGNVTSSLYTLPFTNISSSVFVSAIVTGYDTGSRDTISGEIKGTIRYRAGVASIVGSNYSYLNSDNLAVSFGLVAGSTSGSILVYGTGSRTYQWGATVTTQII